jgi:hypothetical protein
MDPNIPVGIFIGFASGSVRGQGNHASHERTTR